MDWDLGEEMNNETFGIVLGICISIKLAFYTVQIFWLAGNNDFQ